jgi:serine O-acetyltransferase
MQRSDDEQERLRLLVDRIVGSYLSDDRTHHLDSPFLPNRAATIRIIEQFRHLLFPGFFDEQRLSTQSVHHHVSELVNVVHDLLHEQVRQALRYEESRLGQGGNKDRGEQADIRACGITMGVLERIPELRRRLALDIQAAFDGDPAAASTDETIFCYPGIDAIFIHRLAHELYELKVPLLARIMAEYAHNETGIDIHPGAQIGDSLFIDHGTGVVIGETTVIGRRVQVYQGVTLGALAPSDAGNWRGRKRHPTIEDDVTIYGGAIILGGETNIGCGAEIGGTVFLVRSVPPFHKVRNKGTELSIELSGRLQRRAEARGKATGSTSPHSPEA